MIAGFSSTASTSGTAAARAIRTSSPAPEPEDERRADRRDRVRKGREQSLKPLEAGGHERR